MYIVHICILGWFVRPPKKCITKKSLKLAYIINGVLEKAIFQKKCFKEGWISNSKEDNLSSFINYLKMCVIHPSLKHYFEIVILPLLLL